MCLPAMEFMSVVCKTWLKHWLEMDAKSHRSACIGLYIYEAVYNYAPFNGGRMTPSIAHLILFRRGKC